jgi:hypothetical protein
MPQTSISAPSRCRLAVSRMEKAPKESGHCNLKTKITMIVMVKDAYEMD